MGAPPVKSVRAFGDSWSLELVPRLTINSEWGHLSTILRRIRVVDDAVRAAQAETIFHELFHIADLQTAPAGSTLSEDDVHRVAHILLGILRDNPALSKWLIEADNGQ